MDTFEALTRVVRIRSALQTCADILGEGIPRVIALVAIDDANDLINYLTGDDDSDFAENADDDIPSHTFNGNEYIPVATGVPFAVFTNDHTTNDDHGDHTHRSDDRLDG